MTLDGVRVAVTGASGFCGAAVARAAAAAGADVVCLSRRPGPVGTHVPWDAARDRPHLAGADVIVHLAAAVGDPAPGAVAESAFHAVNVDGTMRLLDVAGTRRVVWVSSSSVYDPRIDRVRIREDHPVARQLTAYGRTKAAGERLALDAGAVVVRPRAVYGSGDPHLLPRLRRRVRGGVVFLPGPDVRISLTAVDNLADACLTAMHWPAGAYNVADVEPYWRDAVVGGVFAATGTSVRLVHVPVTLAMATAKVSENLGRLRPSVPPSLTTYAVDQLSHDVILDVSKAMAQGWRPRHTLPDFLKDLSRASTRPARPPAAPIS